MIESSPSSTSATVARWEFARRIKVRRLELDLKVEPVAQHLGFSRNFFSAVENERSMLAPEKLELLCDLLEFSDQDRKELADLNAAGRKRDWWESESTELIDDEAGIRYIGLEQGASSIQTFESLAWPGLFHSREYAAAVFSVDPRRPRASIETEVGRRIRRQDAVFDRAVPIVALISEAVVMQRWSNEQVHHEQLKHIVRLTESHNIEIRIIPFATTAGIIFTQSTLVMLQFDSQHLPGISYEEAFRGLRILEDGAPEFEPIRLAWNDGISRSLSHAQSMKFISELA